MQFTDVIGHRDVKERLAETISHNRLSHALLFTSKEGSGALPLAIAFAQYIMCEQRSGNDSCGSCNACRKAAALVHPDIHFSYPVIPKKSGDKPSQHRLHIPNGENSFVNCRMAMHTTGYSLLVPKTNRAISLHRNVTRSFIS